MVYEKFTLRIFESKLNNWIANRVVKRKSFDYSAYIACILKDVQKWLKSVQETTQIEQWVFDTNEYFIEYGESPFNMPSRLYCNKRYTNTDMSIYGNSKPYTYNPINMHYIIIFHHIGFFGSYYHLRLSPYKN
jgi:hypothetical protein